MFTTAALFFGLQLSLVLDLVHKETALVELLGEPIILLKILLELLPSSAAHDDVV